MSDTPSSPVRRGPKNKPREILKDRRTVRMDSELWEWCKAQGDASEYIRTVILADRKHTEKAR
jgi:hypothetical protein